MTRAALLGFLRAHRYAVEATVSGDAGVQAAVVGIAVLDNFELVFDTLSSTRKAQNLQRNGRIALVIGGSESEEQTVQYEGDAKPAAGAELAELQEHYLRVLPDGRERLAWPGLLYMHVRPRWLRYSDFKQDPPLILELTAPELGRLA